MIGKHVKMLGMGLFTAGALAVSANAAPIPLTNASFESGITTTNPGWTGIGYTDPLDPQVGTAAPAHGANYVTLITSYGWSSMSQNSAYTVQAGDQFTLTAAISNRSGIQWTEDDSVAAYVGKVQLLIDGVEVASNTLPNTNGGVDLSPATWGDAFAIYSATAADIGKVVGVKINGGSIGTGRLEYDNIRLDVAAVPEPASVALLGLSGLAMMRRHRRD